MEAQMASGRTIVETALRAGMSTSEERGIFVSGVVGSSPVLAKLVR